MTVAVDENQLDSLDELPFAKLGRLVTLSACNNRIGALSDVSSAACREIFSLLAAA